MKKVDVAEAAALLKAGEVVAFPTETVYGLGADAANEQAIRKIFAVKGRPYDHPLIVHLASVDQLKDWTMHVPEKALTLAKVFWPGPLTIIFQKKTSVLDIVTGGQDTVGIRIPQHPVALSLLQAFGKGIVAPSANKFTHISPTTAQDVEDELGDKINFILEGGACSVGLESTIIDVSKEVPVILRPGMITAEAISAVLKTPVTIKGQDTPSVRAPGMHHVHYAPITKTLLMTHDQLVNFLKRPPQSDLPAAIVAYNEKDLPKATQVNVITMPSEPDKYAKNLYHTLRSLDKKQFKCIIVEAVPENAEWEAIRDRLTKATAER